MEQSASERIAPQVGVQVPTEAVLVSGIDGNLGTAIGPVVISAARVVGAPINRVPGRRYTYMLLMNGTGGFAITWNAAFKVSWSDAGNTANKRSSISFIDDGTNLNQDGAQSPYI